VHCPVNHDGFACQPTLGLWPVVAGTGVCPFEAARDRHRRRGELEGSDTQALLGVVRDGYRPFQVVALGAPDAQPPAVPLLQDRGLVDGQAAAYVCRDFACQAPVTEAEKLQTLLQLQ